MTKTKKLKVPYRIYGQIELEVLLDSNGNYDNLAIQEALDETPDFLLIENLERNSLDNKIDGDSIEILDYIKEI